MLKENNLIRTGKNFKSKNAKNKTSHKGRIDQAKFALDRYFIINEKNISPFR